MISLVEIIVLMEKIIYNEVLSIGKNCFVASGLGKNGFRSFSGPFDWCVTTMQCVMHYLKTDFSDFLLRENLKIVANNPHIFYDVTTGMMFNHDLNNNLDDEFDNIKIKYQRRIDKFKEALNKGACLVRFVFDKNELDWIVANNDRCKQVLKQYNIINNFVYVIHKKLTIPSDAGFVYFIYDDSLLTGMVRDKLRNSFECIDNNALNVYLAEHYSLEKRKRNIIFDLKNEQKRTDKIELLKTKIKEINIDNTKIAYPIVIYGAADVGKSLYNEISEKVNVLGFIDKFPPSSQYFNKPIWGFSNYKYEEGSKIVLTPMTSHDVIIKDLVEHCHVPVNKIVSLEDWITEIKISKK